MSKTGVQTDISYAQRLYREVKGNIRYYVLKVYRNLFDEYILESIYGSIKNKSPTGVRRDYFITLEEALKVRAKKVDAKMQKGYSSSGYI